jgi:hypothetical protein
VMESSSADAALLTASDSVSISLGFGGGASQRAGASPRAPSKTLDPAPSEAHEIFVNSWPSHGLGSLTAYGRSREQVRSALRRALRSCLVNRRDNRVRKPIFRFLSGDSAGLGGLPCAPSRGG